MADLAELGMRFSTEGGDQALRTLDQVSAKSGVAEKATDQLAGAQGRAKTATMQLLEQIVRSLQQIEALTRSNTAAAASSDALARAQSRARTATQAAGASAQQTARHFDQLYDELQRDFVGQYIAGMNRTATVHGKVASTTRLTANETLNLTRQLSDVGVSLASGAPLWMVLIQQGSQVQDVFAQAANRGVGFKAAMLGIGAALAPLLPLLAAVGTAVVAVFSGLALSARNLNKEHADLAKSLGLTEKQLDRLKDKGVKTSVTIGDVVKGTFTYLKDQIDANTKGIQSFFSRMLDGISSGAVAAVKVLLGSFVGAFDAIKATWRMLPAAIGDVTISAANAALAAITGLINRAVSLINGLIEKANEAARKVGLSFQLGQLATVPGGQIANPFAGAASQTSSAAVQAFRQGFANTSDAVDRVISDISAAILKAAEERIKKAAGKDGANHGPRDTSDQRSAQIDQAIEQAKAEELQAQLALVKDIDARAALEHQIIAAALAVQKAAIARQIVSIETDKGLSRAEKDALELKLGEVQRIQEHVAVLKDIAVAERQLLDQVHARYAAEQSALEVQHAGLEAQQMLARSDYQRALIGAQIEQIEYRIAKNKAEEALATAPDPRAKQLAQDELKAIEERHRAETELAKRETDLAHAIQSATTYADEFRDALGRHDWASAFDSLMATIETVRASFARNGLSGGVGTAASALGSVVGGTGGKLLSGIGSALSLGAAGAAAGAWLTNASVAAALTAPTSLLGGLGASGLAGAIGGLLGPIGIIAGLAATLLPLLKGKPSNNSASAVFDAQGGFTVVGPKQTQETAAASTAAASAYLQGVAQLKALGITLTTTIKDIDIGTRDQTHIHTSTGQDIRTPVGDAAAAADAALKAVLRDAVFTSDAEKQLAQSMLDAGKGFDDISAALQTFEAAQKIPQQIADQILQLTDPKAFDLKSVHDGIEAQRQAAKALQDQGMLTADQFAGINAQLGQLEALQIDQVMKRYADAVDNATEAQQKALDAANDNVAAARDALAAARDAVLDPYRSALSDLDSQVEAARQRLTSAYQRETGAIQQTIDTYSGLIDSLSAFGRQLTETTAANPAAQYAAARGRLAGIEALIPSGDATAIGDLQAAAEAFLQASKARAPDAVSFARDVARVRADVAAAQAASKAQVDTAKAQLDALNRLVSGVVSVEDNTLTTAQALADLNGAIHDRELVQGVIDSINAQTDPLLTINASVLTIPEAIANLQDALTAQAAAQAALSQATAAAAAQAAQAAADAAAAAAAANAAPQAPASAGPANDNAFNAASYLRHYPDVLREAQRVTADGEFPSLEAYALWHWQHYGQADGRTPFATGALVDRPMRLGEMGLAGEAGPEALLPLAIVGGRLGVSAGGLDLSELVAEVRALRQEVADLRTEQTAGHLAIARNTGDTAKIHKRWDGVGLPPTRDVA